MYRILLAGSLLALAGTPVAAQNLTLPAGTPPAQSFYADDYAPAPVPAAPLAQGRSAYEQQQIRRHHRLHR